MSAQLRASFQCEVDCLIAIGRKIHRLQNKPEAEALRARKSTFRIARSSRLVPRSDGTRHEQLCHTLSEDCAHRRNALSLTLASTVLKVLPSQLVLTA